MVGWNAERNAIADRYFNVDLIKSMSQCFSQHFNPISVPSNNLSSTLQS